MKTYSFSFFLSLIHTFPMSITGKFKAASGPSRRYGHKFKEPKFAPRMRNNKRFKFPKPKWMK